MGRIEIIGRERDKVQGLGKKGCGYMGKVISYPVGRYEEVGEMYMDLVFPHCMVVLGKRGSGKSYTLGVIAEEFGFLPRRYRDRTSVIIVDTMSIFHSLKTENVIAGEVRRLRDFGHMQPKGFPNYTRVFMPKLTSDRAKWLGGKLDYDQLLQLSLREIDIYDWLTLFDLSVTEPAGVLIARAIGELRSAGDPFSFSDIYDKVDDLFGDRYVKQGVNNLFEMAERTELFSDEGTSLSEIVRGGQLSVLDLSFIGHIGGFDLRNLVVGILARRLLQERTLQTTLEMQPYSLKVGRGDSKGERKYFRPLVYLMLDEAHLFIPENRRTLSRDPLLDWINLGRHAGLSLIMASQSPSSLQVAALKQSDLVLAHEMTSTEDIQALSKIRQTYMKGSKDIEQLIISMEHRPGLSVVFDDKSKKVEMCQVRPRCALHLGHDSTAIPPTERERLLFPTVSDSEQRELPPS